MISNVQQLLVDLVDAGANEIEGVDFAVIAKADMGAEARRKAVGAAQDRQRCTPRQPGRGSAGGAHRCGRVS